MKDLKKAHQPFAIVRAICALLASICGYLKEWQEHTEPQPIHDTKKKGKDNNDKDPIP